jgi:hypothetical protein
VSIGKASQAVTSDANGQRCAFDLRRPATGGFIDQKQKAWGVDSDGRLMPTLLTASPDGVWLFDTAPLANWADARQLAMTARLFCAAQAASAAVVVIEAWVVSTRPREFRPWDTRSPKSPRCGDYIVLTSEAVDGTYEQRLMPIFWNQSGHFSGLGPAVAMPGSFPMRPSAALTDARIRRVSQRSWPETVS